MKSPVVCAFTVGGALSDKISLCCAPMPQDMEEESVLVDDDKARIISLRVLGGPVPTPVPDLRAALLEAGVPEKLDGFPPIAAFDDVEYETRTAAAWLDGGSVRARCVVLSSAESDASPLEVRDVEVMAYDAETDTYSVGAEASRVPRVLLMFEGEDVDVFTARLRRALALRGEAVDALKYRLCVKDMPATRHGEVTLSMDKLDRILRWTFNTDQLKTDKVDTSALLVEVRARAGQAAGMVCVPRGRGSSPPSQHGGSSPSILSC